LSGSLFGTALQSGLRVAIRRFFILTPRAKDHIKKQMKVVKFFVYCALVLVAVVFALGLFGKKQYHIERSVLVSATPSAIMERVGTWKGFDAWQPWVALDPAMKSSITGTDGTPGATYTWLGNEQVGTGKLVTTAVSNTQVNFDVHFTSGFQSVSPSQIRLEPQPTGTKVMWALDINIPFPWNGFALFTDVDKPFGTDLAAGLERLKSLCEHKQ
jgi:Polyketide cyclase / dehydrase and lipid transport